ncbi:hypothetical protein K504DRAFT_134278 [Pleomassaria siparia CBS 279.74]|uniref:RSE1/DDB1/CPSF1 first beta-propeller domain-containing protein n=1 Tax=Pleomassaria siparia CBS 279.74 TaxID=1314801 RepID=A0A6G1KKW3_9PLEO|nr:hypothetical protein K504DRAFT_134278 [Pleomassaria siparia CBS 279.74]
MEHQIQGMVYENGDWVSRQADVYRIIAGAREADTDMHEPEIKPQNKIPKLGILSRSIFQSPFVKTVLSANIRHKSLNDVVFVSEDAVHLKEIQAYGHLRHAATKSDFTGRILAARVFGEPRKVQVHSEYGKPWDKAAVHAQRRSFSGEEPDSLPPEIIVLTLTSRTLMFLWARQSQSGSVAFYQKIYRVPAATSHHDRLGAFLAVDPKCRAIAVAALEGRFMLYKTRPLDKWRECLREGRDVSPIEDERLIHLQGRVVHMDFLSRAKTGDESHVVLLFVLVHKGKTKITCYDWDCTFDLSTVTVRAERVAIDCEDHNPSLLIPLNQSSDFLLVCNQHIALYRNILSGIPQRYRTKVRPDHLISRQPGNGTQAPLWVQWDRALRNPTFPKEAFYIAREDGMVAYAEFNDATNSVEVSEAGIWPYPLDKAFATLDMDTSTMALSYPDILIAPGTSSDGLLCKVGSYPTHYKYASSFPAAQDLAPIETIPNWAPITDFAVTRLRRAQNLHERERDAMFVANGRAPHGTISELRRGLNAIIDVASGGFKGYTGLWAIDHGSTRYEINGRNTREHYVVLLVTLPLSTSVIRVWRTQTESGSIEDGSWDEVEWESAMVSTDDELERISRDNETISACILDENLTIQVTQQDARLLRRSNFSEVASISFGATNLLKAATKAQMSYAATVVRENSRIILQVMQIRDGAFCAAIPFDLNADPTCLELLDIDSVPHVFVGKSDASFALFRIMESGVLFPVYDDVLNEGPTTGLRMLCESAVVLTCGDVPVIVCGMRNGFLMSLFLRVTDGRYDLLSTKYMKMGSTVAQVTRSATDSAAAFVTCGSDICRVRSPANQSYTIDVDSIWFTERNNPGYKQSPIMAIDQLPFSRGIGADKDLGGFIIAISGDNMLFAQLEFDIRCSNYDVPSSTLIQQKPIPRKLITNATPAKLMYMEKLNKMVVATTEAREEKAPPSGYRVVHSAIQILRLGDEVAEDEEEEEEDMQPVITNNLVTSEFVLKHYERVYSMIEWTFVSDKDKTFHFVIVGTGITTSSGKETGRRLFLNVNETGIKLKKESAFEQPLRCMALYDESTLLSIHGSTLAYEEYDHRATKWVKRGQHLLTSPGTHITVSRPFIYISTAADSHICYEVTALGDEHQNRIHLKQVFSDSRQRDSAYHLVVPLPVSSASLSRPIRTQNSVDSLPSLTSISSITGLPATIVLLTDKACNVTGLFHPVQPTNKFATDTVFEACLPRSITRLQRGSIRPPWRRPCYSYTSTFPLPIPGIVTDDILGSSTDGSVYAFSILSHPALLLLKLLQNLVEAKRAKCPDMQVQATKMRSGDIFNLLMNGRDGRQDDSEIGARDVDPREKYGGVANAKGAWVDGDVVWRWLVEEKGDVRELVREGTEEGVGALFEEFVWDLKTQGDGNGSGNGAMVVDGEEENAVEWTEKWIESVLMPVL